MRSWRASVLLLLLAACAPGGDSAIEDAVRSAADSVVDFRDVVAGEWQRVCFVGPYTTPAVAEARTNLSWAGFERSRIASRDDVSLLVFASGDRVDRSALVARSIEFRVEPPCVPRDSARFRVRGTGQPGFVLLTPLY